MNTVNSRLEIVLGQGGIALLLCEVQEGVLGSAAPWPALAEAAAKVGLVEHTAQLAACARRHSAPVIHCTAEMLPGRFGANANARLFGNARKKVEADQTIFARPMGGVFADGDIMLPRFHGVSPMTGSSLDSVLRNAGIRSVIVTGVSITFAITNLVMDAVNRAYQVILPRDAAAGFPEDYAAQVMSHTLALLATLGSTEEIITAWDATKG